MKLQELKKAGHWPTLLSAFLYFDISFMAWVSLGPLMTYIAKDMHLPQSKHKLSLVAIPVLVGAFLRVPLGIIADTIGSKLTGVAAQAIVMFAVALVACVRPARIRRLSRCSASMLGLAGASFAVALPQAGRWYPPQYQGVVMGLAGAGNMGVVLDTLLAPTIAETYRLAGTVYGVLLVPMVAILLFYVFAAKDAPGSSARRSGSPTMASMLLDADSRWFMFFYFITFGGFVGLASALPLYFTSQYHASGVAAGLMVSLIVAFGSGFRPVGGHIADRVGGIKSLSVCSASSRSAISASPPCPRGPPPRPARAGACRSFPASLGARWRCSRWARLCLGMGNGAVFQLLPQRFRNEIGAMTGLVGAAGGLGGFFLAKTLAYSKGMTGGFAGGFMFFGALALLGLIGLLLVKSRWRTTWGAISGARI